MLHIEYWTGGPEKNKKYDTSGVLFTGSFGKILKNLPIVLIDKKVVYTENDLISTFVLISSIHYIPIRLLTCPINECPIGPTENNKVPSLVLPILLIKLVLIDLLLKLLIGVTVVFTIEFQF